MIYLNAVGLLSALGNGVDETVHHLAQGCAVGMRENTHWLAAGKPTWVGEVQGELPFLPVHLMQHNSRNSRLILAALAQIQPQVEQAIALYGADRVAVVLGTSTSGLDEAYRVVDNVEHHRDVKGYFYQQQELGDPSCFVADYLKLQGPAYTVSTACSSGARSVISGARLIKAGLADAVIVGGADTLNPMSVNGFDSLEVLSAKRCTPFAQERDGINVGEGAALMLLTRERHLVAILGYGESSDAWHMSAPHPEGTGAKLAIEQALKRANLQAKDVGYINLHGTATLLNDQTEAQVIHDVFGNQVPCSSTKHLTGHTLGAAGCIAVALSYLLLTHDVKLPAQDFSESPLDSRLPDFGLLQQRVDLQKHVIASNAFAFGGNNSCLILGRMA